MVASLFLLPWYPHNKLFWSVRYSEITGSVSRDENACRGQWKLLTFCALWLSSINWAALYQECISKTTGPWLPQPTPHLRPEYVWRQLTFDMYLIKMPQPPNGHCQLLAIQTTVSRACVHSPLDGKLRYIDLNCGRRAYLVHHYQASYSSPLFLLSCLFPFTKWKDELTASLSMKSLSIKTYVSCTGLKQPWFIQDHVLCSRDVYACLLLNLVNGPRIESQFDHLYNCKRLACI